MVRRLERIEDVQVDVLPLLGPITDVYYSHAMGHYGTPFAERSRKAIRELFPEATLHCPEDMRANYFDAQMKGIPLIEVHRSILKSCVGHDSGAIVFTEYRERIGRGVFEELAIAMSELGLPVWVLEGSKFKRVNRVKVVDFNDWRHYAKAFRA